MNEAKVEFLREYWSLCGKYRFGIRKSEIVDLGDEYDVLDHIEDIADENLLRNLFLPKNESAKFTWSQE